ncbi:hypothetical protein D3C86_2125990 [compost metagenome]
MKILCAKDLIMPMDVSNFVHASVLVVRMLLWPCLKSGWMSTAWRILVMWRPNFVRAMDVVWPLPRNTGV